MRHNVTEHSVDRASAWVTGSELMTFQRQGSVLWVPELGSPRQKTDRAPEPRALSGCVEPEMNIVTRGAHPSTGMAKTQAPGPAPQCTLSLSLA